MEKHGPGVELQIQEVQGQLRGKMMTTATSPNMAQSKTEEEMLDP